MKPNIRDNVKKNITNIKTRLNNTKSKLENSRIGQQLNRREVRRIIIIVLLFIMLSFFIGWTFNEYFTNVEKIQSFIQAFKIFGPLIIILLVILEATIAPLPGFIVNISAGYLYGIYIGTLLTWIGNIIGSSLAFYIARRYGRPITEKLVNFDKLKKFDMFFEDKKKYLWILYMIPLFPIDILSYASGISKIEYKNFFIIIFFAIIPNVFLFNYFGDQLVTKNIEKIVFSGLLLVTVALVLLLIVENIRKK